MENKKPGIGVGVMMLKDNKILLGKRSGDPEKADSELHGESSWTMPGGKVHFGETLKETAYREVLEETGININQENLKLISLSDDIIEDAHFVTVGFLYENPAGEAKVTEPDEIVEWQWFALDDLPTPIFFPSEEVLKNYLAKKIY
jgi:8-oxo-dGTP diphosphatase